jgi:hypothetical protein
MGKKDKVEQLPDLWDLAVGRRIGDSENGCGGSSAVKGFMGSVLTLRALGKYQGILQSSKKPTKKYVLRAVDSESYLKMKRACGRFAPEVHGSRGRKKRATLAERLCIRPTLETILGRCKQKAFI